MSRGKWKKNKDKTTDQVTSTEKGKDKPILISPFVYEKLRQLRDEKKKITKGTGYNDILLDLLILKETINEESKKEKGQLAEEIASAVASYLKTKGVVK